MFLFYLDHTMKGVDLMDRLDKAGRGRSAADSQLHTFDVALKAYDDAAPDEKAKFAIGVLSNAVTLGINLKKRIGSEKTATIKADAGLS